MSTDFLPRCNVVARCRQTSLYAVQTRGYGRCACERHRAKAVQEARAADPAHVKTWLLGYFEPAPEQQELPIDWEGTS